MNRSCARVARYAKERRFRLGFQGRGGEREPAVPEILTARTNFLRGSIIWQINRETDFLIGRVGVGRQVAYAAIHEFGGYAGRGGCARIPARPYLRPALIAQTAEIKKDLGRVIADSLRQAGLK
jgi:phage gpG-like protein